MGDVTDFWGDELSVESGWRRAGGLSQDSDSGEDLLATWKRDLR